MTLKNKELASIINVLEQEMKFYKDRKTQIGLQTRTAGLSQELNTVKICQNLLKKRMKTMTSNDFVEKCTRLVRDYTNEHMDKTDNTSISNQDVFVVWYSKTLQNHKALLSTTVSDGMYYELTYNGDKEELYFDAYKKFENRCIKQI